MYSDKLLLLKLDDIQEGLYRLDYNLNASDSLAISKLSDMSTSLSDIRTCLVTHSQNTFLGVSWDILLPVLISTVVSLGIFFLGNNLTKRHRRKQKQEEREVVKDAIVIWADKNIPILRKYIHSIKTLADKIKKSDEILPQAFAIQNITIDVLSQFTIDRLTDSLHRGLSAEKEEKDRMLNAYLSSVSYIINMRSDVRTTYENYNTNCNQFLLEWNKQWRAYTQNVAQNYTRVQPMHPTSPERVYYENLTIYINNVVKSTPQLDPPFSILYKLMLRIKAYDNTITIILPAIITTSYIAGEVFIIASHIEGMRVYSDMFVNIANNIEIAVGNFENAVTFFRKNEIVY